MISAAIVVYKHSKFFIAKLIESLVNNGVNKVYILDNSNKKTASIKKEYYEYYSLGKNIGFGRGHNLLQKKASEHKIHFVVNPDIILENNNVLKSLSEILINNKNSVIVAPKILYFNGDLQESIRKYPSLFSLFLRKFYYDLYLKLNYNYNMSSINKTTSVDAVSGAFFGITHNNFQRINGFDERYFMYMEDLDFCREAVKYGRVLYVPHISVLHGYEKGSSKSLKLFIIHINSVIKYFIKWKLLKKF